MALVISEPVIRLSSFDGSNVVDKCNNRLFEVGNLLGGGVAGSVFECINSQTLERYAIKVLNPLVYKCTNSATLKKFNILVRGKFFDEKKGDERLSMAHIWWLHQSGTYVAAVCTEKFGLRDLTLTQCIELWGLDLSDYLGEELAPQRNIVQVALPTGSLVLVPKVHPKYVEFICRRNKIFREIEVMRKISNHPNVIRLETVLELVKDTQYTLFLVMELANGGELFDRIKLGIGAREETAQFFFEQLLRGVKHCHDQGVCHRDLKLENLLLQDTNGIATLKIADFGFSTRYVEAANESPVMDQWNSSNSNETGGPSTPVPLRLLRSIVGSPYYIAPEILKDKGYDGVKSDVWSLGVILYAMLAGNLPFEKDLSKCSRYSNYCTWIYTFGESGMEFWKREDIDYPVWLFPQQFSVAAKSLIVSMLHPDPDRRITVSEAMRHPVYGSKVVEDHIIAHTTATFADSINSSNTDYANSSPVSNYDVILGSMSESSSPRTPRTPKFNNVMFAGTIAYKSSDDCQESNLSESSNPCIFSMEIDGENEENPPSNSDQCEYDSTSYCGGPPIANSFLDLTIDDLILDVQSEEDTTNSTDDLRSPRARITTEDGFSSQPPSFVDNVKKSTRFITSVEANDVLNKMDQILRDCIVNRILTPIGVISHVELNWSKFSLEIWRENSLSYSNCSIQLFQLPVSQGYSLSSSPMKFGSAFSPVFHSGIGGGGMQSYQVYYLVEFVRNNLEIFEFKKFYQWLRQKVSELVKKDYKINIYDESSPKFGGLHMMSTY